MAPPLPTPSIPKTYPELRRGVEAVLLTGRQKIEVAWVETYHETGRLIHEHCLLFRKRAGYGAKTYHRLAADTGVSNRTLRECVQFYRCYPNSRPVAKLGWNRCRLLCQVEDVPQREALVVDLKCGGMKTVDLRARVRALNAAGEGAAGSNGTGETKPAGKLLTPKRGTIGVYRIVAGDDAALAVDLGFTSFLDLASEPAGPVLRPQGRGLGLGDLVRLDARGRVTPADRARFAEMAETELTSLHEGNFARYRLRPSEFAAWQKTWR